MSSQENHQADAWTVAKAKARLSEVIERAQTQPQMITRNGTPSVVMVSVEEWNRKSARQGSLARFLMSSPLAGASVDEARLDDSPRDLML